MIFDILYLDAFEEKYSDTHLLKGWNYKKTIPKDCKYMMKGPIKLQTLKNEIKLKN